MLFLLIHSDHSNSRQVELRRWYHHNGILFSELSGPSLVDTVAQTATVSQRVPARGQQDSDFPEWVCGPDDEPISVRRIVDLQVMPLSWMLTMTGAWSVRRPAATFATRNELQTLVT